MDIRLGDVLRLKKGHPCGGNEWEVHRVGMDFRLQCRKCGRMIMVPRKQAEKNLRLLVRDGVSYKPMDLAPVRAAVDAEAVTGVCTEVNAEAGAEVNAEVSADAKQATSAEE